MSSASMRRRDEQRVLRLLSLASIATRVLTIALVYLASSLLPHFDSSARLLAASPALRWDAFHYLHIAQHGYLFEYEWAFLPGAPLVMNAVARLGALFSGRLSAGGISTASLLRGGVLAVLGTDSVTTLYELTILMTGSPDFAVLSCFMSLIPSSPPVLRYVPIAEPFFTFFSHRGMLCVAQKRWGYASLYFAAAAAFRSNGILLSGFLIWGLIVEPWSKTKTVNLRQTLASAPLIALPLLPSIVHQYRAYLAFCNSTSSPQWCSNVPPSIYTYVQSKYWNVGFLRYWTLQQLPNFLIASPVLLLLLYQSSLYIKKVALPIVLRLLRNDQSNKTNPALSHFQTTAPATPFLSATLIPHAVHALILTSVLLTAAHTQIVLRLAASMPFAYWAAADLFVRHRTLGRLWVGWSILWGAISAVLWAVFLPPA